MRILHAFPFFSIRFAGGTSDFMFKLAKAQVKAGHEPLIYSGDYQFDAALAERLSGAQVRVVRSYFDRAGFSIMPDLRRMCAEDLPTVDIVHLHVFRTFQNVVLFREARRRNIPVIIDAHGSVPYATRKRALKRLFDRLWGREMLRRASALIAETDVGATEYRSVVADLRPERICVLSPPFDTDEYEALPARGAFRRELGIPADDPVISFLGRIHHIKGNDFLIRGFAEFLNKAPRAWLLLLGSDDGHVEECKRLAVSLGIESRVRFIGFVEGARKISALVDSDIVAQMSRQEQGAWAPFEAVLCETPIIVTDHTGAGEDVRRLDAGETVRFGDVAMLSARLEGIIAGYATAKERTRRARRVLLERMSFNGRIGEYTQLYDDALRRAGPRKHAVDQR